MTHHSHSLLLRAWLRRGALGLTLATLAWLPTAAARQKATQECLSAYEQAQRLRLAGQLKAAREQLITCGGDACPADIRRDCAQWLAETEAAIPSVIIAGKAEGGADAVEVRVSIDGTQVAERLDGKAIVIDPGQHRFHFELQGHLPVDQEILVHEREQGRVIQVQFMRPAAPSKPPRASSIPYVIGGVGIAGLAAFSYFALRGRGKQGDLDDSGCKPNCAYDDLDSIKRDYLIANISLGIGLASLGTATVLFLSSRHTANATNGAQSMRFEVGWSAGVTGTMRLAF